MKKFALAVLAAALLFLAPAWAQEEPVWQHGTEEFILQAEAVRDQASGHWLTDITGAWAHFVTDNVQVGAVTTVFRQGADGGYAAGPFYEYNFPTTGKGHFFVGGDAQFLIGDFEDAATAQAATRIGYKLHVGNSSAVRFSLEGSKAVDEKDAEMADSLNRFGFNIGFSIGVNANTPVR